jgi:hypothetical protein
VIFLAQDESLQKFDSAGVLHQLSTSSFSEISAAASNDVYVVDILDSSLRERSAMGVWTELEPAGTIR